MNIHPIHTQPPNFQATWNNANSHLKVDPPTLFQKVCRVAWNIISILIPVILVIRMIGWAVAALSKKATLPSAHAYSPEQLQVIRNVFYQHCYGEITDQNKQMRSAYTVERHTVQTADGASLSAIHFRHRNSNENTPTILYFQPNMGVSELFIHSWLLKEAAEKGCNVIVFDHRTVSLSGGELDRPENLILDGDAIYQFANQYLGIPQQM